MSALQRAKKIWTDGPADAATAPRLGLRALKAAICFVALAALAGCGASLPKLTDLNPFKEKEKLLPGKRIAIMARPDNVTGALAAATQPIALPAQRSNPDWTQPGGAPSNAPGHLALKQVLRVSWRASAGQGSSSDGRLLASPIVAGGRIYTLDAAGTVSAVSTSGKTFWRTSLRPANESASEGFGGGLAIASGRLYATTGFGIAYALDPANGKKIWEQKLGVPVRSSPTAAGDKLFVVATDGRLFCLNGSDGTKAWTFRGLPQRAQILTNVSPAVAGDIVVVPYASGELVALNVADGQVSWTESLARSGRVSTLAGMSDPGRPVIEGGIVYGVGHAGRMIATSVATGERLWTLGVPGIQTPWVAGNTIYVVDITGKLHAIAKSDGKTRWQVALAGAKTWSGPVLAGSRLWLVSNAGRLISIDALSGRVATKQELGGKVYIAPVVAGGRMYVLTDDAKLIALQ